MSSSYKLSMVGFARQFERFCEFIAQQSGEPFESFAKGYTRDNEHYKRELQYVAAQRLLPEKWTKSMIGSGKIIEHVLSAIEINIPAEHGRPKLRNNLVQWEGKWGPDSNQHRELILAREDAGRCHESEQLLFRLYRESADGEVFEALTSQLGRKFGLLAYLYFVKDQTRYMPIAPTAFDNAFERLDVPLRLSGQCSWEAYQAYNAVIAQVRDALELEGIRGVTMLDAHSFCWIISDLPTPEQAPAVAAPRSIQVGQPQAEPAMPDRGSSGPVDFKARNMQRAELGQLAEAIALESERARLRAAGKSELAERVAIVSDDYSLGYDIESFEVDGSTRRIEVKAVRHEGGCLQFYLTRNEFAASRLLDGYCLYLVRNARSGSPDVLCIPGSAIEDGHLVPEDYRVHLPWLEIG